MVNELAVIGLLFLGTLLLLYAMGVPVAIAMGMTSVIVLASPYGPPFNLNTISNSLLFGLNSFALLAIPFYLLLGRLMNRLGFTEDIFDFANSLVGWLRGGIGQVNIFASMLFAGMSGTATADAAGLGRVEYAAMKQYGYGDDLAIGVTGGSSIIGPIIPPSIAVIIYAVLAEESIGELFLAGILPGILVGISLMVLLYIMVRMRGMERTETFNPRLIVSTFKNAIPALVVPVLIIGGIVGGLFTATEAGAVAVLYILAIGAVYGEMDLGGLYQETRDSAIETFALTFIIGMASLYGLVALQLRIPFMMVDSISSVTQDPTITILLLVAMLLVVGTFMEPLAAITLLVPVILPLLNVVGIDPIHFGMVMILSLMIGLLTPPFGVILFVLDKVTPVRLEDIMVYVLPFYIPIVVVLMLIIFFPELVTFVPDQLMG
jgi:tripartite ATP-independent transporter DctM subunit